MQQIFTDFFLFLSAPIRVPIPNPIKKQEANYPLNPLTNHQSPLTTHHSPLTKKSAPIRVPIQPNQLIN
jgi:hypothetical protein